MQCEPIEILPELRFFRDSCNVFLLQEGDHAIAIDFGQGDWLQHLPGLGVRQLDHVFLTHHHADQCAGLGVRNTEPVQAMIHAPASAPLHTERTVIHAPAGEEAFLKPENARNLSTPESKFNRGCPPSYSFPPEGISGISRNGSNRVRYDTMAGWEQFFWRGRRLRFILTPGHGPNACSVLVDHNGKQLLFCGDALHEGGTLWGPYHLEWDHWTGTGALAAWEGVNRIAELGADIICPSHGPVITENPHRQLSLLKQRLMAFYHAKGNISPGEPDRFVEPRGSITLRVTPIAGMAPSKQAAGKSETVGPETSVRKTVAREVVQDLYHIGQNGYLLLFRKPRSSDEKSDAASPESFAQALIIDPTVNDMPVLQALLQQLGNPVPDTALFTHYHADHCDAAPWLKETYGTRIVMHPKVAHPLRAVHAIDAPWLPPFSIIPDELWPDELWPDELWANNLRPREGGDEKKVEPSKENQRVPPSSIPPSSIHLSDAPFSGNGQKTKPWYWNEYPFWISHGPGQTWYHCLFMTIVDGKKVAFTGDSFQPASKWNGTGGFCAYNRSRFREGFAATAETIIRLQPDIIAAGHGQYFHFAESKFQKIITWAQKAEKAVQELCPSGELDRDYYRWSVE